MFSGKMKKNHSSFKTPNPPPQNTRPKKILIFLCAVIFMAGLIASPASAGWSNIGDMENDVMALKFDNAGNLYAGGSFTDAGGVANTVCIAKWDGINWNALGTGMNSTVWSIAFDGAGNLYAGGSFTAAGGVANTAYIAKWDGANWSALGTGMDYDVYALAFDDAGNLYAGGSFTAASGVANTVGIAKWDGANWSALGSGMNSTVSALVFDDAGNLYAGGDFTAASGVADTAYIAKWDGANWSALGTGTDAWIRALAFDSAGNLYAGGQFTTAGGVANTAYIAKWDGANWSALGTGMDDDVDALAFDDDGNLYAGGSFTTAGGVAANYIAKWDGTNWCALRADVDDWVRVLAFDSVGNLYAGGTFTTAGGVAADYIAKWTSPEIDLNQDGTPIADGDTYNFDSQTVESDTDVEFTIENTGTANLTLTTPLTISGADAGEFSIVNQPTSPVAPGDTTTFTVRFSPVSEGAKTATIMIGNNDECEDPYDLNLEGAGTAALELPPPTPIVMNISLISSGPFSVGSVIKIAFVLNNMVFVKGMPHIVLNMGGVPVMAHYSCGSGTNTLIFQYTVAVGDDTSSVGYWSEWALELNGGQIYSNQGIDAVLDLPAPSADGLSYDMAAAGVLSAVYPVYRFYSPGLLKHFFTVDENEKAHLLANAADVWQLEIAPYSVFLPSQYNAATDEEKATLIAVHRFYSAALQTHLYTVDANEAAHLIADAADVWQSDGPVFYVPVGNPAGTIPVYRFYSDALKVHLFTADENEMNHLKDTAGDVWNFEGVAYYAYP